MEMKRISIYQEQYRSIDRLTDAQAGVLLKALVQYARTGMWPSGLELAIDIVLDAMTDKITRDTANYEEKCEKMKRLADKRWHADACDTHAKECDTHAHA